MDTWQSALGFLLCSAAIIYAGIKLSLYGDKIAELTGLGKAWIGLILMAAVTSLPELITGISAVTMVNAPNLAAGDVFGSCVFNLLILSVLDAFQKKPITSVVRSTHVFAGACGIILIAISGAGIFLENELGSLGWISPVTPMIIALYLFIVLLIFKFEKKNTIDIPDVIEKIEKSESLRKVILLYSLHALVVVAAALFLPYFGEHIATAAGMSNSFFGTLFLAATTSLPELVVSISALRMGSVDLAVGNLFGSNIFNICILAVDDLFYTQGSLFSDIDQSHLISILTVIIMTAVAMIGLLFKAERKRFILATDTLIIALLYVALMISLFRASP